MIAEHAGRQGHRARKRFGQHFLRDQTSIEAIVAVIGARSGERLLEIGPGEGVLTARLLGSGAEIDAVEIDRDLVRHLSDRFGSNPKFHLHAGDVLRFDLHSIVLRPGELLRVVGNLPYNISTPLLLRLLFDYAPAISDMVFMLQQEVVERLAAVPNTADYGRLSVIAQALCVVHPLLVVPPEAFDPPPQVLSAVVRLVPRRDALPAEVRTTLERIVKLAFAHRRKTLRHTLGREVSSDIIAQCNIALHQRAQEVPVAAFVRLAELCTPARA